MEFLFDLLFSNLPIIIIVIGVISSFLGKWKTSSPEGKAKRKKIPEIFKEAVEEHYPEKKSTPKKHQSRQRDSRHPDRNPREILKETSDGIAGKLNQARMDVEQKLPDQEKRPAITHKSKEVHKIPEYKADLHFDRQKLIDGIIMSEVLGPPKSRMNKRRR